MYISKRKLIILIILIIILIFINGMVFGLSLKNKNTNLPKIPASTHQDYGISKISDAAQRAFPAVVHVSSTVKITPTKVFQKFNRKINSLGSGIIMSKDGYILTNGHVVKDFNEVVIELYDKNTYIAKVIGVDKKSDIAILKINTKKTLPYLGFADSSKQKLGNIVIAVGNPFGLGNTVTMGIISAIELSEVGLFDYEDFIQTDAAINPGNSGGALVNLNGELIGINTAIISQNGGFQGVGFAIPSNLAKKISYELIAKGKVERGWIGVAIQELDYITMKKNKLEIPEGVVVVDVVSKSPAWVAGLAAGDVITKINGKNIKDKGHLRNIVADCKINHIIDIEVLRNGEKKLLHVQIEDIPENLNFKNLKQFKIPAKG